MLIDINKIIIKDRIRKDFGNIEELAKDIKENGLINPPVVTPEYVLIAGERRTKACQVLNYSQIEVRVMTVKDALHQLKLEISENENRKDFSFSEKMQWAEQLKDEYSKIAKKNQGGRIRASTPIDSNKQVAKDVGFGNKETYRQAKYIYENGNEDLIKQLDEGQLSINKAYNTLKNQNKIQSRKPISNQVLKSLAIRSKGFCEICGWGGQGLENILVNHHIHKYSNTKDNSLNNLIMICPNCHGMIHTLESCNDNSVKSNILNHLSIKVSEKIKYYTKELTNKEVC